jgi:hypothetical protein
MKISVIMQAFLGDYPGARTKPKEKFIRAVNSFLAQYHQEKELVIVSDGCEITKKMYELFFSDKEEIKFCYLHRDLEKEKSMYAEDNGLIYYRGTPREVGRAIATGELITYFDSDDVMLPNRLSDLNEFWKTVPKDVQWSSNPLRLVHEKILNLDREDWKESKTRIGDVSIDMKNLTTQENEKFILNLMVPEGYVACVSYALCHRKDVKTKWKNITKPKDNYDDHKYPSEDTLFLQEMQEDGAGIRQESPSIIICHYKNLWDV